MKMHDALSALRQAAKSVKDAYDIVLFGSATRGDEPQDLDVAIILKRELSPLARLRLNQAFRQELSGLPVEVQVIGLADLEDAGFLARQGILAEGISLRDGKPLAQRFGFEARTLITYVLNEKTPAERRTFNYSLTNRRGKAGKLATLGAERFARGAFTIPLASTTATEEFLTHHRINYTKKTILIPTY